MLKEEQLPNGLSIIYKENAILGPILNRSPEPVQEVNSQSFGFTNSSTLYTGGASTCAVVILNTAELWGLFHGVYATKEERDTTPARNEPGLLTLEDFLEFWRIIKGYKPDRAIVLGANFNPEFRYKVLTLLKSFGLKPGRIVRRWNDHEESDIEVVLHPRSSRITQIITV